MALLTQGQIKTEILDGNEVKIGNNYLAIVGTKLGIFGVGWQFLYKVESESNSR